MGPRAQPRSTKRLPGASRRRQLLDLAGEIVVEGGVAGLTMDRLAGAAGVSKALVYAHFANRDDVLTALIEEQIDRFRNRSDDALAGSWTFGQRVRASI